MSGLTPNILHFWMKDVKLEFWADIWWVMKRVYDLLVKFTPRLEYRFAMRISLEFSLNLSMKDCMLVTLQVFICPLK